MEAAYQGPRPEARLWMAWAVVWLGLAVLLVLANVGWCPWLLPREVAGSTDSWFAVAAAVVAAVWCGAMARIRGGTCRIRDRRVDWMDGLGNRSSFSITTSTRLDRRIRIRLVARRSFHIPLPFRTVWRLASGPYDAYLNLDAFADPRLEMERLVSWLSSRVMDGVD